MTKLAERDARVRAAIEHEGRSARLFDYSVHLRDRVRPLPEDGLREAAEAVLHDVHELLVPREGQKLESSERFAILYDRLYARDALTRLTGSRMEVKRIEVSLSGGHPLAVCTGPWRTHKVVTVHGLTNVPLWYAGCGAVFPDSLNVRGGGRAWKDWCPLCSPEVANPARRLAARHRRAWA